MENNIIKWLWLLHAVNGRSTKVSNLHRFFGSIDAIFQANEDKIASLDFIDESDKEALADKDTSVAEKTRRFCVSKNIEIVTLDDTRYPALLKEIYNYPGVLFVYGNIDLCFSKPMISIVGTRESTSYGNISTETISAALAKSGFTIVTGVADGIDSAAISGALKADGSIISVLPGGHTNLQLDSSYKHKNVPKNGAIISEHLPNTHVYKYAYHERNRIISGLSLGTIITQAPEKSGALITASHAVAQNRDVFALVANADMKQSKGSNKLIKDGAVPIFEYKDIIEYYQPSLGDQIKTDFVFESEMLPVEDKYDRIDRLTDYKRVAMPHMSEEENAVFDCIGIVDTNIDYIIEVTELPVSIVMGALTSLETMGAITACPGNKYKINL